MVTEKINKTVRVVVNCSWNWNYSYMVWALPPPAFRQGLLPAFPNGRPETSGTTPWPSKRMASQSTPQETVKHIALQIEHTTYGNIEQQRIATKSGVRQRFCPRNFQKFYQKCELKQKIQAIFRNRKIWKKSPSRIGEQRQDSYGCMIDWRDNRSFLRI